MSDEKLYLKATNEVEGAEKKPALWAKAIALAEGDEKKAKYKYIALRVEQLAQDETEDNENLINVDNEKDGSLDDLQNLRKEQEQEQGDIHVPVKDYCETPRTRDGMTETMIEGWDEWASAHKDNSDKQSDHRKENVDRKKRATSEVLRDFVSLNEFSALMKIEKADVIKGIREGKYDGRIINSQWYVQKESANVNKRSVGATESDKLASEDARDNYNGIRGWLILLAIGVVINAIDLMSILRDYGLLIASTEWDQFFNQEYKNFISIDLLFAGILTLMSLHVAYLFYKKKKAFAKHFVIFVVAIFLHSIWFFYQSLIFGTISVFDGDLLILIAPLFWLLVWVPYVLVSKRVKATFINE